MNVMRRFLFTSFILQLTDMRWTLTSDSLVSPDLWLHALVTGLLSTALMASITPVDALSSHVSQHPITSRAALRYGAFHQNRLWNGLFVFNTFDLEAN